LAEAVKEEAEFTEVIEDRGADRKGEGITGPLWQLKDAELIVTVHRTGQEVGAEVDGTNHRLKQVEEDGDESEDGKEQLVTGVRNEQKGEEGNYFRGEVEVEVETVIEKVIEEESDSDRLPKNKVGASS